MATAQTDHEHASDLPVEDDGPELDAGGRRLCVATGERMPPDAMVRFALAPDGQVVPDIKARLPGRGVWVGLGQSRLAQAIKKRGFHRGFRKPVIAEPTLVGLTDDLLERDALQTLALANKAGAVMTGFEKVRAALQKDAILVLIHASEAAQDGVAKLGRLAAHTATTVTAEKSGAETDDAAPQTAAKCVRCFSQAQLSVALGYPHVIHAGVRASGIAEKFLASVDRLQQFRAG